MGGALTFHRGGRSQEDAGTFRTGESAVFVVVIVVPPRHIVRDQIPAVLELVLGGLGKDWGYGGGDGAGGGGGGATGTDDLCGVLLVRGEIERRERDVWGKL